LSKLAITTIISLVLGLLPGLDNFAHLGKYWDGGGRRRREKGGEMRPGVTVWDDTREKDQSRQGQLLKRANKFAFVLPL
jgi:hypothetical protein